jgi:preprotein translocase subunit SecD
MNANAQRILFSWFTFWVLFAAAGLYLLWPIRQSLKFGIDLVGGTYITLAVQTEKAVEAELVAQVETIEKKFTGVSIDSPTTTQIKNNAIVLTFDSNQAAFAAAELLKSSADQRMTRQTIGVPASSLEQSISGTQLTLSFSDSYVEYIEQEAVLRNIEVLRTRLNPLNIGEITIAAQGERNIIVELPDVADRQQAKNMIGKSALLEFKLVEQMGKQDDILYEYDGELPADKDLVPSKERDLNGEPAAYYLVSRYTTMTGKHLKSALPDLDQQAMQAVVKFEFTPEGGDLFYELTSKNLGKPLAIVLDGIVISAPVIQAALRSSGVIQGSFTPEDTKELALLLKSGAYVAPVTFEEEREIGPALGAESIKKGLMSCFVGLVFLFFFSIFYYKTAGLLAFVALIYNLFLVLIGLGLLQATLTLPGIAGMVLTIGMAIDASILIYEKIKEELTAGTRFVKAVNTGFSDAMVVILDANITTFIVGVVLYKFGTGPVQGFAVTMMLGIISTLITGLFFLKAFFNFILTHLGVQTIKI